MTVLITLTTAGADSGPFDLYSNVDGYVSAFETGVSKAALVAGYSSSLVPNGTTTIRVKSTGVCTNYIDIIVVTTTTTTTTGTPPPPTTTTTTTAAPLVTNLIFDLTSGIGGYTIGAIDVNGVIPTLTSGTDVPFSTDTHGYNTNQTGAGNTLTIVVSIFSVNGCITVTDSGLNVTQLPIGSAGTYTFPGLTIDNITPVQVVCTDGSC